MLQNFRAGTLVGRKRGKTNRTEHIFTVPGEGEVTLSFKREGSDKVYSVTSSFSVSSRKDLGIPRTDVNIDFRTKYL